MKNSSMMTSWAVSLLNFPSIWSSEVKRTTKTAAALAINISHLNCRCYSQIPGSMLRWNRQLFKSQISSINFKPKRKKWRPDFRRPRSSRRDTVVVVVFRFLHDWPKSTILRLHKRSREVNSTLWVTKRQLLTPSEAHTSSKKTKTGKTREH